MNVIGPSLLALTLAAVDGPPAPKQPADKDGYNDYPAALNDRLAKGVTPETNANVLILKALGPKPQGFDVPPEYFKRMGMDLPPARGDYFVELKAYMRDHPKRPGEVSAVSDQLSRARQRPWAAMDYPHIAAWLKANEKPLALVMEATKRPHYFNPVLVSRTEDGPGRMIDAPLPSIQLCRELAAALTARAMLRVSEGKSGEAWRDLLACHRLGRHVGRGAMLIEGFVGDAIDQSAAAADLAYLGSAKLSAKQLRDCLADLQRLPPIPSMADSIDLGGRFMYLDSVEHVRRGGVGVLKALTSDRKAAKPTPEEQKALRVIDWEPAIKNGNRWHDRWAAALRLKTRPERTRALDELQAKLKERKVEVADKIRAGALSPLLGGTDPGPGAAAAVGDLLIGLMAPAAHKIADTQDRAEQVQRNLRVAFALAAYRADTGLYPAKLGDLAPKYLAAVPDDLFAEKPLVYRPAEKGYLLYSVGVNGKDDGGRWTTDDPPGDDLRVRMPLPETPW